MLYDTKNEGPDLQLQVSIQPTKRGKTQIPVVLFDARRGIGK